METDRDVLNSYAKHINPAYVQFLRRLGLERIARKAEGVRIEDSSGKSYIDCVGSYGLLNLGHNHPRMVQSLRDQLSEKQQFTRPLVSEIQVRFAERIAQAAGNGLNCSFLCNSGSEAVDSAIKLVRLYKGQGKIIAAENSFHGYTFGAMSASGIQSFRKAFEPLVPGIIHVPYGSIDAIKEVIGSDTAGILLEPIQHEAGIFVPSTDYFLEIRRLCDEQNVILMIDEIKTGFGRTGALFAFQHFNIAPDVLILGKSMGGGMIPIGAIVAKEKYWKRFGMSFSMSASSFAGNVLACRAALTTMEIIEEEGLVRQCEEKGSYLLNGLREVAHEHPEVMEAIDGMGLLLGIKVRHVSRALGLAREMIREGVIAVPAYGNPSILMIEPPLVISYEEMDQVLDCIRKACERLKEVKGGKRHGDM